MQCVVCELCNIAKNMSYNDTLSFVDIGDKKYSIHVHKFSCEPSIIDINTYMLVWNKDPTIVHVIYARNSNELCMYKLNGKLPEGMPLLPAVRSWFLKNVKREVYKCE